MLWAPGHSCGRPRWSFWFRSDSALAIWLCGKWSNSWKITISPYLSVTLILKSKQKHSTWAQATACYVGILYWSTSLSHGCSSLLLIHSAANKPEKAVGDDSRAWAPATRVGDWEGVSGSWLQPGPSQCNQLRNEPAPRLSPYISLYDSAFQVTKHTFNLKKKKKRLADIVLCDARLDAFPKKQDKTLHPCHFSEVVPQEAPVSTTGHKLRGSVLAGEERQATFPDDIFLCVWKIARNPFQQPLARTDEFIKVWR